MAEKLKFRALPGYLLVEEEKVVATGQQCRAKIGDRVVWSSTAAVRPIKIDRLPYIIIHDADATVENITDE